ncbi:hypothetical protein PFISCL1PPCAC_13424 [Pristionchus fissidentatus]|uniref:EGF-like domain-containing protein n=1 Tax=Pristionchus fissidentatus TaxID=1538716 RepID=A0AAV5VTW5_9BILA|nr:hypothetical protein PFISCL1PPCAC_13424 [Pristionchus fissidentatus]
MTELTPIYELILEEGAPPDSSTAHVIEGTSLEVRCTVTGNDVEDKTITILRDSQRIEPERSTMSAVLKIPSFHHERDGGMYECSTVIKEKKIRRKLRLRHKAVLPPDMEPCAGNDSCRNGGVCGLIDDATSICICPEGYVGPRCEDVLVRDFIVTRTKMGVAAGGTANLIFVVFAIVLGLLFLRERKRRRHVEHLISEISEGKHFETLPLVKEPFYEKDRDQATPPSRRSSDLPAPPPEITNPDKKIFRTYAVKKVIAPGEDDSLQQQPHSS